MSKKVYLSWDVDGIVDSFNYYRYDKPTPIDEIVSPTVSNITEANYTDTSIIDDKDYYFRISSVRSGVEKFSDESSFTTIEWIKKWILENVSVGDAWIAKKSIVDENNQLLSIPSLAGNESDMVVSSGTKPVKNYNHLVVSNSKIRLNDTNKNKWSFLHDRNKSKFMVFALKINNNSNAQIIACTGEPSTSDNTAFCIFTDYRSIVQNKALQLFQCSKKESTGNPYTSIYSTTNPPKTNENIIIEVFQSLDSQSSNTTFYEDYTNMPLRSFQERPVEENDPATVLTLFNSDSGDFPIYCNFYGALIVDKIPSKEDRVEIYKYMRSLFDE